MAILKPLIQKLWASGGAVVQPSDTKIETGWTAEVPPHQWENWIQNRQDQYLAHINERGVPEWDGNTDYLASGKSFVQGSDGVIYKSVAASGPSTVVQDPVEDITDTYWRVSFADALTTYTKTEVDTKTSIATAAESQALVTNNKLLTPLRLAEAFKGSNQLLATNGYQKYPGGYIEQWGLAPAGTGEFSITFPIAFTTENFVFSANHTGTAAAIISELVDSRTVNGLTARQFELSGAYNGNAFWWKASGY